MHCSTWIDKMGLYLKKCPVCRARRSLETPESHSCPRCGADLTAVNQCYEQAGALRDGCRRSLAEGRFDEGLSLARRARFLVDEEETRQSLAAALIAKERVSEALGVAFVE